jgi:hypothetical protein
VSAKSSTAEPGCEALRWGEREAAQGVIDIGDVDPGVRRRNRVRTLPQTLRVHRPFTLRPGQTGKRSDARVVTMRHEAIISATAKLRDQSPRDVADTTPPVTDDRRITADSLCNRACDVMGRAHGVRQ